MTFYDDKKLIRLFFIQLLIFFSSLGMALCGAVRFLFYDNNKTMMENPFWFVVTIAVTVIFIFALVVLFPVEVFIFGRKERKNRTLKKLTFADLFLLPFGAANPDAQVPRLIKYPLLAFLFLLIGIFTLICLAILISSLAKHFLG